MSHSSAANNPPPEADGALHTATREQILGPAAKVAPIPRRWAGYYHHLLRLREQLMKDRADLQRQASTELPVEQLHHAEAATDEFDHDLAWSLLAAEQNALSEIEEALRRIQDGSYGRCEATGQPIDRRRLEAIPWARFTTEARAQLEAQHAVPVPHVEGARSLTGEQRIGSAQPLGDLEITASCRAASRADIVRSLDSQPLEDEDAESGE